MQWRRTLFGYSEADARAELYRRQVAFDNLLAKARGRLSRAEAVNAELRQHLALLAAAAAHLEAERTACLSAPAARQDDPLQETINRYRSVRQSIASGVWELISPYLAQPDAAGTQGGTAWQERLIAKGSGSAAP